MLSQVFDNNLNFVPFANSGKPEYLLTVAKHKKDWLLDGVCHTGY